MNSSGASGQCILPTIEFGGRTNTMNGVLIPGFHQRRQSFVGISVMVSSDRRALTLGSASVCFLNCSHGRQLGDDTRTTPPFGHRSPDSFRQSFQTITGSTAGDGSSASSCNNSWNWKTRAGEPEVFVAMTALEATAATAMRCLHDFFMAKAFHSLLVLT